MSPGPGRPASVALQHPARRARCRPPCPGPSGPLRKLDNYLTIWGQLTICEHIVHASIWVGAPVRYGPRIQDRVALFARLAAQGDGKMAYDAQVLRSSFNLALERQPNLTHVFYDELFARHPSTKPLFDGADMAVQEQMLAEALVAVMDHLEDVPWLQSTLAGLGAKHAGFGVTTEMYDWVGGSLIATLAKANGQDWTAAHTARWQEAYEGIVTMMLAGYPVTGGASAAQMKAGGKEGRVRRLLHLFDRPGRPGAS